MIYPEFLKEGDTIGVTALSAGVGRNLDDYKFSIKTIENLGFKVCETKSVRVNNKVSNTAEERAKELDRLVNDEDISMVLNACGGDFALEVMPHINEESIKNNVKWFCGASDPTSFLYYVTTKFDIATLYGYNAGSFDQEILHKSQFNFFDIISGEIPVQHSFDLYEDNKKERVKSYALSKKVYWEALNGNCKFSGRLIGGCVDVLRNILGTRFDYTKEFVERYKEDGIVWYFDNFALGCEDFYLTLFQMKEAGWFNYVKGIVVGRVMYPSGFYDDFKYQDALLKIFGDLPIIFNADIGHVCPKMTLINGALVNVECSDGKGSIKFKLD